MSEFVLSDEEAKEWLEDINNICRRSLETQMHAYIVDLITNKTTERYAHFFPAACYSIIKVYFSCLGFEINKEPYVIDRFYSKLSQYVVIPELDQKGADRINEMNCPTIVVFRRLINGFYLGEDIGFNYLSESDLLYMVNYLFLQNEEKYTKEILRIFSNEIKEKLEMI